MWQDGLHRMDATDAWPKPAEIWLPPSYDFGGRFSPVPAREQAVWQLLFTAQQTNCWVYVAWPRLVSDVLLRLDPKLHRRELISGKLLERFHSEPSPSSEGQTLQMFRNQPVGGVETRAIAGGLYELLMGARVVCVSGIFYDLAVDAYGLTLPVVDLLYRKSVPSHRLVRPASSS